MKSQSVQCGFEELEGAALPMINQVPLIEQAAQARLTNPPQTVNIPIHFTQIDASPFPPAVNISTEIAKLNSAFANANFNFQQCGSLNLYTDSRFIDQNYDNFTAHFTHIGSGIEVHVNPVFTQPAAPIPSKAYLDNNPNWSGTPPVHDNVITTPPSELVSNNLIHETGHHFGLFHTFRVSGFTALHPQFPNILPSRYREPYPVLTNPPFINSMHPYWWGRELVIQDDIDDDPLDPRPHKFKNYDVAGDLAMDTHPDCDPYAPSIYPGCLHQIANCAFPSTFSYKDDNNDPIQTSMIGNNFMSYWSGPCRTTFTEKQIYRVLYYYETYRKDQYADVSLCGNFEDKIEKEGSASGISNTVIRVRHPGKSQICNVMTKGGGSFSGILYDETLTARVLKIGSSSTKINLNNPLNVNFDFTEADWRQSVDINDVVALAHYLFNPHILLPANLSHAFPTGYKVIAADVDLSNSVTAFDYKLLKFFVTGKFKKFNHDQPFRFMPEFVPQDNAVAFKANPFQMTINGNYVGANYLLPSWVFNLSSNMVGKKGFDGVKIGDVCDGADCLQMLCEEDVSFERQPHGLAMGEDAIIKVKLSDIENATALQMGFKINNNLLEINEVIPGNLPGVDETDNSMHWEAEFGTFKVLWVNLDSTSAGGTGAAAIVKPEWI